MVLTIAGDNPTDVNSKNIFLIENHLYFVRFII